MKRLLLTLILACPFFLTAQNGLITIPMPVGYTYNQLRFKNALAIDNAFNKWVGFKSIGLGKYDGVSWTMFDTGNSGLPSDNVRAVLCSASDVWCGTDAGAARFNGSTWTVYNTSNSGISSDTVYSIAVHGTVFWFGTNHGLCSYNGSTWTTYTTSNSGIGGNVVNSVAVETGGNVWAATATGTSSFNGSVWTTYTTANSNIGADNCTMVHIDNGGERWFSAGGIYLFDGVNFREIHQIETSPSISTQNFLCGNGPHGNALIRSNGLSYERTAPPSWFFLSVYGINPKTAWESSTGRMWLVNGTGLTTSNELYCFDPSQYNGIGLGLTPGNIKLLDINEVSAPIMNRGDMHWNLNSAGYEVPKGDQVHPLFASAIWLGGLDSGGHLHQAAMTYRQTGIDFWPGPLDTTNGMADSTIADQFDYIWKIERLRIQEFQYYWSTGAVQNGSYIPDHDILTWPGNGTGNQMHYLAPFIDVNGNGIYDPLTGGDYPDIKGDEELYWIFNDNIPHSESGGQPFKVEIHGSAYAFYCPSIPDSQRVLNYTTYYDFKIYNWSGQPYHSNNFGIWEDMDLGAYDDDYVGCYPQANIGFTYNGDMNDGTSALATTGTYGAHPPVCSVVMLDGPPAVPGDTLDNDNDGTVDEAGEHNMMGGFYYFNNDFSPTGNPEYPDDYYGYLVGKWKDSTLVTQGGNGYGGTTPTHFMYPGLPYDAAAWSEATAGNTPFDRRFIMSCGPFNLDPGVPASVDYAIMFTRDTMLNPRDTALWDLVLHNASQLRQWRAAASEPSCITWAVGIQEQGAGAATLKLFPNPASTLLTIETTLDKRGDQYRVFDMTGQVVKSGSINAGGQTTISVEDLAPGIYAVQVYGNGRQQAVKFIRQ